jgi:hypothetical protein
MNDNEYQHNIRKYLGWFIFVPVKVTIPRGWLYQIKAVVNEVKQYEKGYSISQFIRQAIEHYLYYFSMCGYDIPRSIFDRKLRPMIEADIKARIIESEDE